MSKTDVHIDSQIVEIVSSTDYLGAKLCLSQADAMDTELDHRIARAWAKFGTFRSELTNKRTNLFDRLRLFGAVVTPCALYGSSSWSLKRQDEQEVNVAQRRMLRAILGKGRRIVEREETSSTEDQHESNDGAQDDSSMEDEGQLESWADWFQRTTTEVRSAMTKLKMDDWVTTVRKWQWKWASKVVQHDAQRWIVRILHWQPKEGMRQVGHPRARWIDPIEKFASVWTGMTEASGAWIYLLSNAEEADSALKHYVDYCNGVTSSHDP